YRLVMAVGQVVAKTSFMEVMFRAAPAFEPRQKPLADLGTAEVPPKAEAALLLVPCHSGQQRKTMSDADRKVDATGGQLGNRPIDDRPDGERRAAFETPVRPQAALHDLLPLG